MKNFRILTLLMLNFVMFSNFAMDCELDSQKLDLQSPVQQPESYIEEQTDESLDCNELPLEIQSYIIQLSVKEDRDIVFLIHDILKARKISKQWADFVKSKFFWKSIFTYFWKSLLNVNAKVDEINIQVKQSKQLIKLVCKKLKYSFYRNENFNTPNSELWKDYIIPTLAPVINKIELFRKQMPNKNDCMSLPLFGPYMSSVLTDNELDMSTLSDNELADMLKRIYDESDGFFHPQWLIGVIYLYNGYTRNNQFYKEDYIKSLQVLLDNGINLNVRTSLELNTPLMIAAALGELELVRKLIQAGADLNIRNKKGYTALFISIKKINSAEMTRWWAGIEKMKSYIDIARILIDSGADVNLGYERNNLPLLFFAWGSFCRVNANGQHGLAREYMDFIISKLLDLTSYAEKEKILEIAFSDVSMEYRLEIAALIKESMNKENFKKSI